MYSGKDLFMTSSKVQTRRRNIPECSLYTSNHNIQLKRTLFSGSRQVSVAGIARLYKVDCKMIAIHA
jgi:hypothetical protein